LHSTKCYYNGLCGKNWNTQAIINIKNKIGKVIPFKLEKHGNTKKKKFN
jgi:isoprenylcysteine carboxyl methyltransferase (ICMT) family protein YpbQ